MPESAQQPDILQKNHKMAAVAPVAAEEPAAVAAVAAASRVDLPIRHLTQRKA